MQSVSFTFRELKDTQAIMEKFLVKKSKPDTQSDHSDNSNQSASSEKFNKEEQEQLKRKVVRNFNTDWEKEFFVVEQNGKPFFLLCHNALSENRRNNIERHFKSKHGDFNTK